MAIFDQVFRVSPDLREPEREREIVDCSTMLVMVSEAWDSYLLVTDLSCIGEFLPPTVANGIRQEFSFDRTTTILTDMWLNIHHDEDFMSKIKKKQWLTHELMLWNDHEKFVETYKLGTDASKHDILQNLDDISLLFKCCFYKGFEVARTVHIETSWPNGRENVSFRLKDYTSAFNAMSMSNRVGDIISDASPFSDDASNWNEQGYNLALYLSYHNKYYDAVPMSDQESIPDAHKKFVTDELKYLTYYCCPSKPQKMVFRKNETNTSDQDVSMSKFFVQFMPICMEALMRLMEVHVIRAGLALETKGYCFTYIYPMITQLKDLYSQVNHMCAQGKQSCENLAPIIYRIFNDVYDITKDYESAETTITQYSNCRDFRDGCEFLSPPPPPRTGDKVITVADWDEHAKNALVAHKKAMYHLQLAKMKYAFCRFKDGLKAIWRIHDQITNCHYLRFCDVQTWAETYILNVKILIPLVTTVRKKGTSIRPTHDLFEDVNTALNTADDIVYKLVCTQMERDGSYIWRQKYKSIMLQKLMKLHAEVNLREAVLLLKKASQQRDKTNDYDLGLSGIESHARLNIQQKIDMGLKCMKKAEDIDNMLKDQIKGITFLSHSDISNRALPAGLEYEKRELFVYNEVERACYNILALYVKSRVHDHDALFIFDDLKQEAEKNLEAVVYFKGNGRFEDPAWSIRPFSELFLAHLCQLKAEHQKAQKYMLSYVMQCVSTLRENKTQEQGNRTCFACGKRIFFQKDSSKNKRPTWCAKCKVVQYCSIECQEYDFKRIEDGGNLLQPGGHGLLCDLFQKCDELLEYQEMLANCQTMSQDALKKILEIVRRRQYKDKFEPLDIEPIPSKEDALIDWKVYGETTCKDALNRVIVKYLENGPNKIATRELPKGMSARASSPKVFPVSGSPELEKLGSPELEKLLKSIDDLVEIETRPIAYELDLDDALD